MSNVWDTILQQSRDAEDAQKARDRDQEGRVARILAGCTLPPEFPGGPPKIHQKLFLLDPAKYKSLRCPRRAGKSFAMAALAVYIGESRPNSRILVISLTLKSTKENYWSGSPSGIFTMDRLFDLGLKYHHTDLVWHHTNGSRGRLAGAETRADIEYLRGAAAEADVVLIDECKSFAPGLLQELIREVLEPGLMTRDGIIVMGGTPGLIPRGPFYEATCESNRVVLRKDDGTEESFPTCVNYVDTAEVLRERTFVNESGEEEAVDEPWSLHSWTVKDNTAAPGQWRRALRIKRRAKWGDDHPTWRREYLGEWVQDGEGLVYTYASQVPSGRVTWYPEVTRENRTGLPVEDGPWHLVFGLDLGFEDETALVVAAYSERIAELRHVWDFKKSHMYPPEIMELLENTVARFGQPVAVVGDAGNLGKMLVEWFLSMGVPMEKAEKVEKFDHIELMNGDFLTGAIKIIKGSDLDNELSGLQWDLSDGSKAELAHSGKLREDKRLPNHLCDALLYLWRYSFHHFARRDQERPAFGSPERALARELEAERRHAGVSKPRKYTSDGYPGSDRRRILTSEGAVWESTAYRLRN